MSELWGDKPENPDSKRLGIPPLQNRQGAPVLPPPPIPSHNSMESGGYYSLPSISRLGNSTHNFALNPVNNGINPPSLNFQVKSEAGLPGPTQPQGNVVQAQPQNQLHQDQQAKAQAIQPPQSQPQPQGQPQGQAQQALNSGASLSGYRPLNVKDALSYLDQVKVQFQNRPDVYNHFLDIMKDFKSQSIDTPGVIDRVSTLFRGHPTLIQGFNTFLPPGYRIECSLDPSDPNSIKVTTPLGTTTTIAEPKPRVMYEPHHDYEAQNNAKIFNPTNQLGQQGIPQNQPSHQNQQNQHLEQGQGFNQPEYNYGNPDQQSSLSHLQAVANKGNLGVSPSAERKAGGPVEFNHAINYVNKIKTRFSNQPDIYKHFLEILQTYQREQKPIAEVYSQVTILFQNAPDLLDDFKQFLPDTSGNANAGGLLQTQQQAEYYKPTQGNGQGQLPPVGNFSPPTIGKGKKVEAPTGTFNSYDATKPLSNKDIKTSNLRGSVSGPRRKVLDEDTNPTLVPGVPEPVEPHTKTSNLVEEISFFDKVKKAIGSKQSYNEFLKIINLFNQDLIDRDVLIERVEGFIGSHQDLFEWFKSFVGYEDKPYHIENITFKKHQLDLLLCKPYGPSYRKLPKVETYMPCSGRDEMCWEVLNDEWVSHPTWASEDSGFIAHRKNQYEEILFRIEEERHEYDFYMEANLRTIQTLETIGNRIANMTPEEKTSFKLLNGLGGHTSQTIYKKVIRKIYGKEKGFEVIDALHENPAIAVPVILKRLKQKDEEWRKAHREWNKVWREMEQKVFFKSLDHLGLTFKQADKKLMTTKQLISEISTIKSEQTNKRLHPLTPKSQRQLDYDFFDNEVLYDITKLVYVFLNSGSSYSANDKERLYDFFKSFISLFFSIDPQIVDKALAKRIGEVEANQEPILPDSNGTSDTESSRKRHRDVDLLKDVLRKSKQSKSSKDETPESSVSPNHEPTTVDSGTEAKDDDDDTEDHEITEISDVWVQTSVPEIQNGGSIDSGRNLFNLFGNSNIYIFFRHLRVLYDRLLEVKNINDEVTKDIKSRSEVKFAKDLNLISNQLEDLGLEFVKDDAYSQLLALSERVIEGDVENQWFEESLRQAYRNRAYKLYTVDKVTQALVKHLHSILTDPRSSEIIVLFEKDRKSPTTSAKDQIIYRNAVRAEMNPEENMFRIEYDQSKQHVSIEYVALEDLTLKDQKTEQDKWNYYLTSYIIAHPTEGVNLSELRMPFSKAHDLEDADDSELEGFTDSQLKIKLAPENYKLFFEPGSFDEFTRYSVYNNPSKAETKSLEKLSKKVDHRLSSILEGEDELETGKERLNVLFETPEKYLDFIKQTKEKAKDKANETKDDEADQTIEKEDETLPDASIVKKVNPAIALVKEQDVTVDADSTIPQDDTEIKGNDTTTDENAQTEDINPTDTTSIITEQTKPIDTATEPSSVDKDGDTNME